MEGTDTSSKNHSLTQLNETLGVFCLEDQENEAHTDEVTVRVTLLIGSRKTT